MKTIAAIILAGGKGKRMKMKSENKVTVTLAKKPMITHIVQFMQEIGINTTIVVVGFAARSVMAILRGIPVIYAEQKKRLGTGHAVACALPKLPEYITDVIVVYGDDAVLYTESNKAIVRKLFAQHSRNKSAITFLTIEQENPFGLGRIVRKSDGTVQAIIEEKDANLIQKKITEINPGCFVFSVSFLRKYLPKIRKSSATGEYYLTGLIDLAISHNEIVDTLQGGKMAWRGVNTPEELRQAEQLYLQTHSGNSLENVNTL